MAHYYHIDSEGEDTNLQLHAYRHAKDLWEKLQKEYNEFGDETEQLKERCVLVLATLGLSISQLLGQNNPTPGKDVPYPIEIFGDFVEAHRLDPKLRCRFERFNYFYNGCRHFGRTTGSKGYERIDELTVAVAQECYQFGLEVWRTVIAVYRAEEGSDLNELSEEDLC